MKRATGEKEKEGLKTSGKRKYEAMEGDTTRLKEGRAEKTQCWR